MKFKDFAVYLDLLEKTSSRIEITKILAELFRKSDKGEIDKVVYLSLGGLVPQYKGIVFNIAERMMAQAIAKAYGQKVEKVRELYKKKGDLGDVVFSFAETKKLKDKRTEKPTITDVYNRLFKIAQDEGEGSQDRKIVKTADLLSRLDPLSAKFVARIPIGNLRLGFSDKTVLDALSWMEKGDKSAKNDLEKAYYVLPDVGLLAKNVKSYGVRKAVKKIKPVIGVPVLPMLAQRLKSPAEMIEKMGEVAVEPKFDGLRISLHYKSGKNGFVKAFTRNMNETSWMFPELKDISKYISANEIILDSEAVGVDEVRQGLANFQKTMTRRRKHEIQDKALKIPIKFYVFDIIIKDGKSLLSMPYLKRRKILAKTVKSGKVLEVVDYQITSNPKTIEKEMAREVKEGMEGIIVKRADSEYVAGRTGWRWVKMKEAESKVSKLSDTLDCVVMGYTGGRGKRVTFGIGQFLVGIKDNDKIKTVTKVGTGLTDELFREMKKRLKILEVNSQPKEYEVDKNLKPDFWVAPSLVVEIAADEITKSPKHTAGYALRFPRLIRFRDDKSPAQVTTVSEVKKLYKLQ
jgi:DNA ligase-1